MGIVIAVISTVIIIAALLMYLKTTTDSVAPAGSNAQNRILGVGISGLVLFGYSKRKMSTSKNIFLSKKGIVLTTTLLATIIFVVVICLVLFLIFAGIQSNAGSTAGGFFYGTFDSIMKIISGVV